MEAPAALVTRRSDFLLRLIAVGKLLKAAALVAVAIGLLSHRWLHDLHPNNHLLQHAIARVLDMRPRGDRHHLARVLVYAALFVVEGIGLLFDKLWAEYMTTIITMSFIPVELYELIEHGSGAKAAVLVLNIFVVIYLVWRLHRDHHWPFRKH